MKSIKIISLLYLLFLTTFANAKEMSIAFTHENYNFFNLFERFSKETGIAVKTAAFSSSDLKVELLQRAGDNLLPDAVIVPADYIGLEEIKFSLIPASLNDPDTDPQLIESLKLDGKQYGIPIIAGNHLVMYFNRALINQPAKNWEELKSQRQILKPNIDLIGWSYNEMYWFLPFLTAFGQPPLIGHTMHLDTLAMQKALAFYWSFAQTNLIDENCDYQCTFTRFTSGKLAYMINGAWANGKLSESLGDKLGIATLPNIGDEPMRPYYSAHVIAFPNNSLNSENSEALRKFAAFFQSYETQTSIWYEMNSLPVNKQVKAKVDIEAGENEKAIFNQLNQSIAMPTTREMAIVWEAIGKGVNRYKAGVLSLEKASEYMQHVATRSVEEFAKD